MTLRHPAKGEERCLDSVISEEREDAIGVSLDPRTLLVPNRSRKMFGKRLNLEIVLNIDRHSIDDRHCRLAS